MTQNNPFSGFMAQSDFSKFFENYDNPAFQSFLETQRKNIQALTEAQQLAFQSMQTVAHRQAEILSQIVEDNSSLTRELLTEGTPEDKISSNAEIFKSIYERTVDNLRELAEIVGKSNEEASAIINKRVSATMNEIQAAFEKSRKKAK